MQQVWIVWEWDYQDSDIVDVFDSEEKARGHIVENLGGIKTKFCGDDSYNDGHCVRWTIRRFEVH